MSEADEHRTDCPDCVDGGRVVQRPEAGYATCLDCGERGYWGEDGTEWWRHDPDSQWYIGDEERPDDTE